MVADATSTDDKALSSSDDEKVEEEVHSKAATSDLDDDDEESARAAAARPKRLGKMKSKGRKGKGKKGARYSRCEDGRVVHAEEGTSIEMSCSGDMSGELEYHVGSRRVTVF